MKIESALQKVQRRPAQPGRTDRRASQLLRFIDLVRWNTDAALKTGRSSVPWNTEAATFMDGRAHRFQRSAFAAERLEAPAAEQAAALLRALESDVQPPTAGVVADRRRFRPRTFS
jgi:hypothetical protein